MEWLCKSVSISLSCVHNQWQTVFIIIKHAWCLLCLTPEDFTFELHHAEHKHENPLGLFFAIRPSTATYNYCNLHKNLLLHPRTQVKTSSRADQQFTKITLSDGDQWKHAQKVPLGKHGKKSTHSPTHPREVTKVRRTPPPTVFTGTNQNTPFWSRGTLLANQRPRSKGPSSPRPLLT